ncbi:MAG: hypothetical protein ACK5Q5_19415, partial [Planctomycetaceae bacterium]
MHARFNHGLTWCTLLLAVGAAVTAQEPSTAALQEFQNLDSDNDGGISLEELLAGVPEPQQANRRRTWRVYDFDGSQSLSIEEYRVSPLAGDARVAGIPDPVRMAADEVIAAATASFKDKDGDGDGQLTAAEWPAAAGTRWYVAALPVWDRDQNGQLSADELISGLRVAYGLESITGVSLRDDRGRVFNWRGTIVDYDKDGDLQLSHEEFTARNWRGQEAAAKLFQAVDADGDGFMTLPEMAQSNELWIDVVGKFLGYDQDLDGRASLAEIGRKAFEWERPYIPYVFPAFDLDGDGQLSLPEFRGHPFGNLALVWNTTRKDLDADARLSLDEFHPTPGWEFRGLSQLLFERLDCDHSGWLELREFSFDVNRNSVPADVLLASYDADQDGSLTLAEAFQSAESGAQFRPELERHRLVFARADIDGDDRLQPAELTRARGLAAAVNSERQLQSTIRPTFLQRDTDGDGQVTLEETLAGAPADQAPGRTRLFRVFDIDRDARLSWLEYLSYQADRDFATRGPIPDPVVQWADEELSRLQTALATDDGGTDREAWTAALNGQWCADRFADFDRDGNGRVSREELRGGVAVAYGVESAEGLRLRSEAGRNFYWRGTINEYDRDGDLRLSREELAKYWKGPEEGAKLFEQVNQDGDEFLTLAEMTDDESLWFDVVNRFLGYDQDLDGLVSLAELQAKVFHWEQPYLPYVFPAFDDDGDGLLSLAEFREHPFGNMTLAWNATRKDLDHDGRLSLVEFHPTETLPFLGLSQRLLDRLDRDHSGWLEIRELKFDYDPQRIPSERLMAAYDRDDDGTLSIAEAFQVDDADGIYQPLLHRDEAAFSDADTDANGRLSPAEFAAAARLAGAIETERRLRDQVLPAFAQQDQDGDGRLTLAEAVSSAPEAEVGKRTQSFQIFDFDRDARLSSAEFVSFRAFRDAGARGDVPDPVANRAREETERLLSTFAAGDRDNSGTLDPSEWAAATGTAWYREHFADLDRDHSGTVSREEVRSGLAVAYGLMTANGLPLRDDVGRNFYWRGTINEYDRDGDLRLSREELSKYWKGAEEGAKLFEQVNRNGDEFLSLDELTADGSLWTDVIGRFLQ